VDGVSRQHCKQCGAKPTSTKWFHELDRTNELVEHLEVHTVTQISQVNAITMVPEFSDAEIGELQADDPYIGPVFTGSSQNVNRLTSWLAE